MTFTSRIAASCLALALSIPGHVLAQDEVATPLTARSVLEAFSDGLHALAADFEQIVVSPDGEVMEEGAGEVWLARPDLFRWAYLGEFPELIVADGERVWLYDESLEQVTVHTQSGRAADSPLMLITDLEGMAEEFQVVELGTVSGQQMLQLTAKDPEAQFERMLLGFQHGELSRLILEDAFGLRTEMTFSAVQRNPEVPEGHFRFTPPAGVDLVGDVPPELVNGQD